MIEAVSAWVKEIIYVVLFATFMEFILPESSMQKFVRVIIGLLIMLAIINPVVEYLQMKTPVKEIPALNTITDNRQFYNISNNNVVIERNRLAKEKFERDLSAQITATVKAIEGVKDAETKVYLNIDNNKPFSGVIEQVTVLVSQNNKFSNIREIKIGEKQSTGNLQLDATLENKIKSVISQIYQISSGRINVKKWD